MYATKKVVRKVAPKKTIKVIHHCSICGKTGHTKTRCPRIKRTKKVNYVIQNEADDPENLKEEYIVEEEDSSEEESEDDDEYVDDPEGCSFRTDDDESNLSASSRNCYAVKKKWGEVEYL